jgi:hypothetical protein
MAERRLGDVQDIRRPRQPARLMDGADRPEVAKLDVHY